MNDDIISLEYCYTFILFLKFQSGSESGRNKTIICEWKENTGRDVILLLSISDEDVGGPENLVQGRLERVAGAGPG